MSSSSYYDTRNSSLNAYQYQQSLKRALWQQNHSLQSAQMGKLAQSKMIPVQVDVKKKAPQKAPHQNDYSTHYIESGVLPTKFLQNVENPTVGYPKLQKLMQLKRDQVARYAIKPYGFRCEPEDVITTLNKWIVQDMLQFDVIMIGSLTENQFVYPLLSQLPLDRLCSKPGFLFIWASSQKIKELTAMLKQDQQTKNNWSRKFRRSEELVFVPVTKDSPHYPYKDSSTIEDEIYFQKLQWHCWMCITGTVRRSTDNHLINCNINTDLAVEKKADLMINNAVPEFIYQVAENFSSSTRRLHIIPSKTGIETPVRCRKGWVILSPDILLNNFNPEEYKRAIEILGDKIPISSEVENLRPKSPVNLSSSNR